MTDPIENRTTRLARFRSIRPTRGGVAGATLGAAVLVVAAILGATWPRNSEPGASEPIAAIAATAGTSTASPSSVAVSLDPGLATIAPGPSAAASATTPADTGPTPRTTSRWPVEADAAAIAPGIVVVPADHRAVLVLVPLNGATVLARLDQDGRLAAGWPLRLAGATRCEAPLPGPAGSVRILCFDDRDSGGIAFGFDVAGKPLSGWPVSFPEDLTISASRQVAERLVVVGEEPGPGTSSVARVLSIAPTGAVTEGSPVESQSTAWRMSPDGVAYGSHVSDDGASTTVVAFDASGIRPGWPIELDGRISAPDFAPRGLAMLVAGGDGTQMRVIGLGPGGASWYGGRLDMPVAPLASGPEAERPADPIVAADGTVVVLGSDRDGRVGIVSFDSSGTMAGSWPVWPRDGITLRACGRGEADCWSSPVPPAVGPKGTVAFLVPSANASGGGGILALDRNGDARPGWPLTLRKPAAEFAGIWAGPRDSLYAVAVEPEAGGATSATVMAISPDRTVLWVSTVVQP